MNDTEYPHTAKAESPKTYPDDVNRIKLAWWKVTSAQ